MSKLEPRKQKRLNTLTVLTTILLAVIVFTSSVAPGVEAGYGSRMRTDSWGDAIRITANYNIAGGHVDYQAVSGKNGIKVSYSGIGYTLGVYIARILRYEVRLKCYNSAGNVIKDYRRTYSIRRSKYTKTVSVPSGTVRIKAYMKVKFQLLISPFPTRSLSLSLYA